MMLYTSIITGSSINNIFSKISESNTSIVVIVLSRKQIGWLIILQDALSISMIWSKKTLQSSLKVSESTDKKQN